MKDFNNWIAVVMIIIQLIIIVRYEFKIYKSQKQRKDEQHGYFTDKHKTKNG